MVNPWIHDFAAFDFWLKPLGLLRIAGNLREAGAEVQLLDLLDRNHPWLPKYTKTDEWGRGKFFAEEIPKPQILEYVPRRFKRYGLPYSVLEERLSEVPDADAVLVTSSMTYWYTGLAETIALLRKRFPGGLFLLGGVYATLMPEHARINSGADAVIRSPFEANRTYLESLLDLKLKDINCLPAWDLYPKSDYVVMSISRGCPFRCTYCASHRLEPVFVAKDNKSVLGEIKYLSELGIKRIAFYDDALMFHPDFDELMKEIIKMGAIFNFHTPNGLHLSEITSKRAELMKAAGFSSLYLSLETTDEDLLARTGAKLSPEAFVQATRILRKTGFTEKELHAYVLFGLPHQSEESVKRTIDLAIAEGITPHLAEFSPVPGTVEYVKAGLEKNTDPLLTNNTAYFSQEQLRDSWERLKDYLKEKII